MKMIVMNCPKEAPAKSRLVIGTCNLLEKKGKHGLAASAARFGAVIEPNGENRSVFFRYAGMAYHEKALQYRQESDSPKECFKRGVYLGKAADQYARAGDFDNAIKEYKDAKHALQFAGAKSSQYSGRSMRDLPSVVPVEICKIKREELDARIGNVDSLKSILLEKRGSTEGYSAEFKHSLRFKFWDFVFSWTIPKTPA